MSSQWKGSINRNLDINSNESQPWRAMACGVLTSPTSSLCCVSAMQLQVGKGKDWTQCYKSASDKNHQKRDSQSHVPQCILRKTKTTHWGIFYIGGKKKNAISTPNHFLPDFVEILPLVTPLILALKTKTDNLFSKCLLHVMLWETQAQDSP